MARITLGQRAPISRRVWLSTKQVILPTTRQHADQWELVYSEYFDRIADAIASERRIKGWSRGKKEALIEGDFEKLKLLSRPHPSRRGPSGRSSG
jgi:predicted GIY-YIG superfamily endonuclease